MGIRTRETTEYFPKIKNTEETATTTASASTANNANSNTASVTESTESPATSTASSIRTSIEEKRIEIPIPVVPVIDEIKVQEKAVEEVVLKNEQEEEDQPGQEQKAPKSSSKSKGANKIMKNGIVKANDKMKKGMRIMMEKSNKILERSKNCKKQTKKAIVKPRPPAARTSARLCRKNSGDSNDSSGCGGRGGRSEDPLRTVELIKRPLELRDPATKLLYLASMGLYPMSDPESDSTPIVIISEEVVSPGGRRGKMRCMELPLMPNWGNSHSHNHNHNSNQRQTHSESSLLLQIAPISTPSVSTGTKTYGQPVEGSVPQKSPNLPTEKNGLRKSRKKSADKAISQNCPETTMPVSSKITNKPTENTEPLKAKTSSMVLPTHISTLVVKEISINCGTTAVAELSTKNYTDQPIELALNQIVKPASQKSSLPCLKKRKSLETIIKEIPMLKPDLPLQKLQSENMPAASCPVESLSCNPILEGLMNKPVKKRAPKRKPPTDSLNLNQTSHFQNPITMTVPLQPAPGIPNNSVISMKELSNKQKKSKFQLPTLLPASLLSFSSLLPNNNELTFSEKPKKPRKPRAKKPKEVLNSFSQQNNFLSMNTMKSNQFPQLPYLPPHLEAFFHNALPLQTIVPRNPDEALDLCVKARPLNDFKIKKSKDMMMPQSILKPMSSMRSMEDDIPLNLVLSRPHGHLSSTSEKDPLPLKTLPENKTIAKPQENLDSVKQMLARLHTKIAPAVDGVQLITIE